MTDHPSLLPHENAGAAELALERTSIRATDFADMIRPIHDPATCPAAVLPWLAWARSVDEWQPHWPDDRKRAVIAASVGVHRKKGTRAAVVAACAAAGYGDAEVIEFAGRDFYAGAASHDGAIDHQSADHWAEYRVNLARPITIAQAAEARRLIESVAPARCHLKFLNFTQVAWTYDNSIAHDGAYSHGAA